MVGMEIHRCASRSHGGGHVVFFLFCVTSVDRTVSGRRFVGFVWSRGVGQERGRGAVSRDRQRTAREHV